MIAFLLVSEAEQKSKVRRMFAYELGPFSNQRRPQSGDVAEMALHELKVKQHSIMLAHGGVLFMDELGEFSPSVLDGLRQPLEEGVVRVARARASATLPARFLLVAATNPCPCGGGAPGACECGSRISG